MRLYTRLGRHRRTSFLRNTPSRASRRRRRARDAEARCTHAGVRSPRLRFLRAREDGGDGDDEDDEAEEQRGAAGGALAPPRAPRSLRRACVRRAPGGALSGSLRADVLPAAAVVQSPILSAIFAAEMRQAASG